MDQATHEKQLELVVVNAEKIEQLEALLALYYSAIGLWKRGHYAEDTKEWEEDLDVLQEQAEELLGLDEATITAAFGEEHNN